MILFYDTVGTSDYMTLFKDSDDKKRFYFSPTSAQLARRPDGKLHFAARLFTNNGAGFAIYNFAVIATIPEAELERARADLVRQYGPDVHLTPIESTARGPKLEPLTDFDYKQVKCMSAGVELRTMMACSFRVEEWIHPQLTQFFTSSTDAWHGVIGWQTETQRTPFKWEIRANWRAVFDHFRAQAGIKYWEIGGNLSTEINKLIQSEKLQVKIVGGKPEEREKVRTIAEQAAARLFKPTLEPKPQPGNAEGAIFRLALDHNHSEENKESIMSGEEAGYQDRDLEIAAMIGGVPSEYFSRYTVADYDARIIDNPLWPYSYATDEELKAGRANSS